MRKFIIAILVPAALVACTKTAPQTYFSREIALRASADVPSVLTRAPYNLTEPSADAPLAAAVWVSTTSKSYQGSQAEAPGSSASVIDFHNTACFTSSDSPQLMDSSLYYPSNGDSAYFVGLSPKTGWSASQDVSGRYNRAECTFDGKTDILYAPEVGAAATSDAPRLRFSHMLTWLRIYVSAPDSVLSVWGDLNSIAIESNSRISINFDDDSAIFSDPVSLPAYVVSEGVCTDTEFSGQSARLPESAEELAYVLCSPVVASSQTGSPEYSITITTSSQGSVTVPVNLASSSGAPFEGSTAGRQFSVTLKFKYSAPDTKSSFRAAGYTPAVEVSATEGPLYL